MSKPFKPTWLYIKQHNTTGLKYFGKTIRDPNKYLGSGVHWRAHLNKHGLDVTTVWCQLFDNKETLVEYALKFSTENKIVESAEWANIKPEDGLMGGSYGTVKESTRQKIRENSKNYRHTESSKEKIRTARAKQAPTMLGKKHSDETKQKIKDARAKQIMVPRSEEFKQKISLLHKGKKRSPETCKKISEARKELFKRKSK